MLFSRSELECQNVLIDGVSNINDRVYLSSVTYNYLRKFDMRDHDILASYVEDIINRKTKQKKQKNMTLF